MITCENCRFNQNNKCVKFNISISNDYKACSDYASNISISESLEKIQLND